MKIIIIILAVLVLSSCASSGSAINYTPREEGPSCGGNPRYVLLCGDRRGTDRSCTCELASEVFGDEEWKWR